MERGRRMGRERDENGHDSYEERYIAMLKWRECMKVKQEEWKTYSQLF